MAMEASLDGKMRLGSSYIQFARGARAMLSLLCKICGIPFLVFALCISDAVFAAATDMNDLQSKDQDAILDAVAQINHINWVINTIKTYKNPIVLDIESQKVSPGNLYLDRIPDRAALERIKQILITLHDLGAPRNLCKILTVGLDFRHML